MLRVPPFPRFAVLAVPYAFRRMDTLPRAVLKLVACVPGFFLAAELGRSVSPVEILRR